MSRFQGGQEQFGLIFLIGCTACGKSEVALLLAERLGAEILSVDSMMIYRGMDIGTAKPSPQQRRRVPHHLIDVVEPAEPFSVARYVELADQAIKDIHSRGKRVVAVGGTALYIRALTEGLFAGPGADPALRRRLRDRARRLGSPALHAELARLDPDAAARIHPNDLRRIERALEVFHLTGQPISALQQQWDRPQRRYPCRFVGLRRRREDLNHRINLRVGRMIADGLVEEVRRLLASPGGMGMQARQALGYAQIVDYLEGRCTLERAIEQIKIHTRRLAKSQRTWFRRFRDVTWLDLEPDEPPETTAGRVLSALAAPPTASPDIVAPD